MKKLLILALLAVFLLGACAAGQQVKATATPVKTAAAVLDTSLATPNAGSATVRGLGGVKALVLQSQPDPKSSVLGQVVPGEEGKVLGVNSEGTWVLVQFSKQTGWAPAAMLDLVLVQ
jgi:hypothetical protein